MNEESLNKSVNVVLPENYKGDPVEIIVRHGNAPKPLDPSHPVKIDIHGVINAPLEFLKQRVGTGQFEEKRCHVIVDRNNIKITLIINEDSEEERGEVSGSLSLNPKYKEFGINTGHTWAPAELGLFFKMNRAFFPDKAENMSLVTELLNFTASVSNSIERSIKEKGDKTDNFSQAVNSNLPEKFTIALPLFKGMATENIEVETFAHVDGRDVSLTLLSPGANQTLEDVRDSCIDEQIEQIIDVAPNIVIIEV